MAADKSQNTAKTGKRKPPSTAWKKGQSGNPGGRPKKQQSITHWLNEFGNMTPHALADQFQTYANELKKVKGNMPVFAHVAIRALMELMNEPTPGVLSQILERTEGKVSQPIDMSWRTEFERDGINPSFAFERMVAAAAETLAGTDGVGSSSGGQASSGSDDSA